MEKEITKTKKLKIIAIILFIVVLIEVIYVTNLLLIAIKDASMRIETDRFNGKFSTVTAMEYNKDKIIEIADKIVENNQTNTHKVKYNGTEDPSEIKEAAMSLDEKTKYYIKKDYDCDGFIVDITVNKVIDNISNDTWSFMK